MPPRQPALPAKAKEAWQGSQGKAFDWKAHDDFVKECMAGKHN
jgi:hypothetical protein